MTETIRVLPKCGLRLIEPGIRRTLGERIVALRERREWSQGDLARRLGVGRARLGKWEKGEHAPPLAGLLALSETFGVSVDALLTGAGGERAGPAEWAGIARAIQILAGWLGPMPTGERSGEDGGPQVSQAVIAGAAFSDAAISGAEIEASDADPGAGF